MNRTGLRARHMYSALACVAVVVTLPATAASKTIGTLVLNAYKPGTTPDTKPVTTRTRLARHGLYVATIQGTVSYYAAIDYTAIQAPWAAMCGTPASAPMFGAPGGSGPVSNDAEFIFAEPTRLTSCAATVLPVHWLNLQANVGGGWSHPKLLSLRALNAPTASHSYEYALVGRHRPASFRLTDPDTRDDYGSLRISIRRAVSGDCAGRKYKAFGFPTARSCASAASVVGPAPPARSARPVLTLDQRPITHVLRGTDMPKAKNLELPSGALTAGQFIAAEGLRGVAAREALLALKAGRFVSAALSAFATSGPTLTSTAIELGSPAQAEAALSAWGSIAARYQVPRGTAAAIAADAAFRHGLAVTFTPGAAGALGGIEVLAAEGEYLYLLRAVQQPDVVSQAATEQLLQSVIARR